MVWRSHSHPSGVFSPASLVRCFVTSLLQPLTRPCRKLHAGGQDVATLRKLSPARALSGLLFRVGTYSNIPGPGPSPGHFLLQVRFVELGRRQTGARRQTRSSP